MTEVVIPSLPLQPFVAGLLIFGFFPGLILRLLVRLYPKNNPRRMELIGWRPVSARPSRQPRHGMAWHGSAWRGMAWERPPAGQPGAAQTALVAGSAVAASGHSTTISLTVTCCRAIWPGTHSCS